MSLQLKTITAEVVRETLNSEILFKMEISVEKNFSYVPIEISGELISGKIKIANLIHKIRIDNSKSIYHNKTKEIDIHSDFYNVIAPLSKEAIEHIQNMREKDSYKDVLFTLNINIKYLTSSVYSSPNPKNLIGNDDLFLQAHSLNLSNSYVEIPSSVWLNNYLSIFYNQRYLVLEIPKPNLQSGSSILNKKMEKALVIIPKLEKKLSQGEWSEVIKEARPIIELFKINKKQTKKQATTIENISIEQESAVVKEFKNLFRSSNYSEDAINQLTEGLQKMFNFCGKFIHSTDNSGENVNQEITASKEDAYLVYALCTNFVNLVAKKMERIS